MSGADASQTTTLKVSVGVILMKKGFGMTAVGTPSTSSDAAVESAARSQKRLSRLDRNAARPPGRSGPAGDVPAAMSGAAARVASFRRLIKSTTEQ